MTVIAHYKVAILTLLIHSPLLTAAASPLPRRHAINPRDFLHIGPSPLGAPTAWTVALAPSNVSIVEAEVRARASPDSPLYGAWMQHEEVRALTAPNPSVRAAMAAELAAAGAVCRDLPHGLQCTSTVGAANALFKATLHAYKHASANGTAAGAVFHRVPPEANFTVPRGALFVNGMVDFPSRKHITTPQPLPSSPPSSADGATGSRRRRLTTFDHYVVPQTLWSMYGTSAFPGSASSSVCSVQFGQLTPLPADLATFAASFGVPAISLTNLSGTDTGAGAATDGEATLDVACIASVGGADSQCYLPFMSTTYGVANGVDYGGMYELAQFILAASPATLPSVFSFSYVATLTPAYAGYVAATDAALASVALLGVTVVVASGDDGTHSASDQSCAQATTNPTYPASSPWVLSVGATQLQSGGTALSSGGAPFICTANGDGAGGSACAGGGTEVAASRATGATITSGGGFSLFSAAPWWQSAAVATYAASGASVPLAGAYSAGNRAYPDVAALGHHVLYVYRGNWVLADGSSASAPYWASIVGLANAARLAAGKPPLGFVNPALYAIAASTPAVFTDVTSGDNGCTQVTCGAACQGFAAATGWDPVTGLGTPNAGTLIPALVQGITASPTSGSTRSSTPASTPSLTPASTLSPSTPASASASLTVSSSASPTSITGTASITASASTATQSLALSATPTQSMQLPTRFVGAYTLGQGAGWWLAPATSTCREACATVFGGGAVTYTCSVSAAAASGLAWIDGSGDESHCPGQGGGPVADTFKSGTTYGVRGALSAFVNDNCPTAVNYCWGGPATITPTASLSPPPASATATQVLSLSTTPSPAPTLQPGMTFVGTYVLGRGQPWQQHPPPFTCCEACAAVFGGTASGYRCSVSAAAASGLAWIDGTGDESHCPGYGGGPVADTFKNGEAYGVHGAYSAYVVDNCPDAVNYCWRAPADVTATASASASLTVSSSASPTSITGTASITASALGPAIINTIAGGNGHGYSGDGGAATAAQLSTPFGVAIDSNLALYFADNDNYVIRKVAGGVITTIAGSIAAGASSVAVDSNFDVYVADTERNVVNKISGGVMTRVAGSGGQGYSGDGGAATAAQLYYPQGVAVDSNLTVYIADIYNSAIRKVAGGVITTIAGGNGVGYSGDGGAATAAQIGWPCGVAVDSNFAVYIADYLNAVIRKVVGGVITTIAGGNSQGYSGDGGAATAAKLYYPEGVAVDSNFAVYIADTRNNAIRKVAGGVITTIAGGHGDAYSGDGGSASAAQLSQPWAVAVDSNFAVYIADTYNYAIRRVVGGVVMTTSGTASPSLTVSVTPSRTGTRASPTNTPTHTTTASKTASRTPPPTRTGTGSPSKSETDTKSSTVTTTSSRTVTKTSTVTKSQTKSASATRSATRTASATCSATRSAVTTRSATRSAAAPSASKKPK